jgi:hypothetical protein
MFDNGKVQRVKLSAKGISARIVTGGKDARGWTIPPKATGRPITDGCIRVHFDHKKRPDTLHESFVEIAD